jgi:hypothetical protein
LRHPAFPDGNDGKLRTGKEPVQYDQNDNDDDFQPHRIQISPPLKIIVLILAAKAGFVNF